MKTIDVCAKCKSPAVQWSGYFTASGEVPQNVCDGDETFCPVCVRCAVDLDEAPVPESHQHALNLAKNAQASANLLTEALIADALTNNAQLSDLLARADALAQTAMGLRAEIKRSIVLGGKRG
jgi:hypothetical protein